ncbi:CLUMA_CG002678, isoform A, partial [Clunio marinus]
MKEIFQEFVDGHKGGLDGWFDSITKQALDSLDDHFDEKLKKHVMNVLNDKFMDTFGKCVDGASAEPYAVICYGDSWNNNIMYRCENGIAVEVRLLDWQVMRYASP